MKIAVCFFGITRSLSYTIGSIKTNILSPAQELGQVRVFAHFFRQKTINNPRSGEAGVLKQGEHELLSPDWLELEEPETCLAKHGFDGLKAFGDEWRDDFRSLRNLVHQLHSLERVTEAALAWAPDIYIFARPDLQYHDDFAPFLAELIGGSGDVAYYPNWQLCGGLNDRFLICRGHGAAKAYGQRIRVASDFCYLAGEALRSEKLVAYAIRECGVRLRPMPLRASRVRANGALHPEKFDHPLLNTAKRLIITPLRAIGLWPPLGRSNA